MPPIPIHKDAPIKPDGITPSTAAVDTSNPPPTRTTPAYVPATTTQESSQQPPAPQPGAVPVPPTASAQRSSNGPPPSQPGYTAHHIITETRLEGPPPQFTQPPPNDAMLAGRSTTTSTTASKPGPTTLSYGPVASPFQKAESGGAAATVTGGSQEGRTSLEHPPGYQQAPDNAPYTSGGGIGRQGHAGEGSSEGIGATAWNMLNKAGEALKKGEEAAWKAVRNK